MAYKYLILALIVTVFSCESNPMDVSFHKLEFSERKVTGGMIHSNSNSTTYLPAYSSIHSMSEKDTRSLTITVSIHNMNLNDSLFVSKIDYYNTGGEFVRSYIDYPIFINPMETINIVVHQSDNTGGTGANFLIDWTLNGKLTNPPLIEAIMISTVGQQGISFMTRGVIMD